MPVVADIVAFFTSPSSIGFAMLIGAGLGIILYLMKHSRESGSTSRQPSSSKSDASSDGPVKPF